MSEHPQQTADPRIWAQLEAAYADRTLGRSLRRKMMLTGGAALATLAAALVALVIYGLSIRTVGTPSVLPDQALRITAYVCALLSVSYGGFLFATSGPRNNSAQVVIANGQRPDTAVIMIRSVAMRRWPWPARRRWETSVVSLAGNRVPEQQDTGVHQALAAAVRQPFPLRVSLSVARRVADVAWERWLAVPLDDLPPLYMERFYPRYLGLAIESAPPGGTYWVLAPQRWQSLVLAAMPDGSGRLSLGFPRDAKPHDVLVLVATAIDTPAGRRLVVRQGDSPDSDLVLEPDGAAAVGANVMIVGVPGRGGSLLSAAESATALRECAADLVQAGVQTAVVVPNTSADQASKILAELAPIMRPGLRPSAKDQVVLNARQMLAPASDPSFGYELTVMRRP